MRRWHSFLGGTPRCLASLSSLAVAIAAVFAVSFFAYGQLGGANGIVVPYQGRLEQGGVAVNGPVTLEFRMYADGSTAAPCHTQSFPVAVVNGTFSVQLTQVDVGCVRGAEPQVAISVDDGSGFVDLAGRQRLFPAPMATTSGSGDFAVTSSLVVGNPTSPTVALHNNVSGDPMVAGSNTAGNLHIDSNTPARGGDGSLYLNYYSDRAVRFARGSGSGAAAEIDADGNFITGGDVLASQVLSTGLLGVDANDGNLGASRNFYFRDTGDSWLRLRPNLSNTTAYADLAVGNFWVQGELHANGNTWNACGWTGWISEEQGAGYCGNGSYVAGMECSGAYCDNRRLYCCTL